MSRLENLLDTREDELAACVLNIFRGDLRTHPAEDGGGGCC